MEIAWEGDYFTVVRSDEGYEAIDENDIVIALPRLDGEYIIRLEKCPPYEAKDRGDNDRFYTMISGTVEDGETPLQTLRREMGEETPIRPSRIKLFDRKEKIPFTKVTTSRVSVYHFDVLEYEKTEADGDGSDLEAQSTYKRVSYEELQDLASSSDRADFTIQYAANLAIKDDI